jgi:two-component system, sensor histidine kinase and response regulator
MMADKNRRILLVDDNQSIHDDFRKILVYQPLEDDLSDIEPAWFGAGPEDGDDYYTIDSAYQGPEAAELARRAVEAGMPYAIAFVDMRMPPSWDGIQTIEKIWEVDDEMQIVLCTAYSDYSWSDIQTRLGATDRLLVLRKPFDVGEIRQLACALTEKWQMGRHAEALRAALTLDITHRKEVERLKDAFISTVSHELRTPLTSIRGALGLLEGGVMGPLSEDALGMIHIARVNADRLTRLINEILDLEKMVEGGVELTLRPVFIPRLVRSTLEGLRAMATVVGVELRAEDVPPVTIRGDEDRLAQVLTNLVANAIKFSPPKSFIEVRAETAQEDRVRVSVIDQGKGIAEADHSRLFGKFQQVDNSDTRGQGGIGLGLAISKAIVDQHGGEIGLYSRVGHGSTFWFELPAHVSQERAAGVA